MFFCVKYLLVFWFICIDINFYGNWVRLVLRRTTWGRNIGETHLAACWCFISNILIRLLFGHVSIWGVWMGMWGPESAPTSLSFPLPHFSHTPPLGHISVQVAERARRAAEGCSFSPARGQLSSELPPPRASAPWPPDPHRKPRLSICIIFWNSFFFY